MEQWQLTDACRPLSSLVEREIKQTSNTVDLKGGYMLCRKSRLLAGKGRGCRSFQERSPLTWDPKESSRQGWVIVGGMSTLEDQRVYVKILEREGLRRRPRSRRTINCSGPDRQRT